MLMLPGILLLLFLLLLVELLLLIRTKVTETTQLG